MNFSRKKSRFLEEGLSRPYTTGKETSLVSGFVPLLLVKFFLIRE